MQNINQNFIKGDNLHCIQLFNLIIFIGVTVVDEKKRTICIKRRVELSNLIISIGLVGGKHCRKYECNS